MKKFTLDSVTAARNTTKHVAALLGLAILLSACDGESVGPTSPTTSATASATFTLSGAVSEMTATGPAPLEGARILELRSGRSALTDAGGFYSIPGLSAMSHALSVTKEGYVTESKTVTLSADTHLDIQLTRVITYILSGVVYEVTGARQVPVEGVEIYCDSCGSPVGHTFVHTDADGFYSLAWASNGLHPLFVTKAGYEIHNPAGTLLDSLGRIRATVSGDTRFDIQLTRR